MVVQLEAESFIANLPPPQRLLCHEKLDKPGGVVAHHTITITEAKPTQHMHTKIISFLSHAEFVFITLSTELPYYHKISILSSCRKQGL